MSKKVVLVCDPGIDGAFAIALATYDPDLEVVGMLATAGNVAADQATKNVRIILDQLDPPLAPVGAAPNVDYSMDGAKLHGPLGLGHTDFPCASLHHLPTSEKLLVELARLYPNELTVICMAPLTVLSRAFDLCPDLPELVKRFIVVGGSMQEPGNAGPVTEFHFGCDPEAARRILHSKAASLTLVPLDVTRKVLYAPTDLLGGVTELSPAYHFLRQIVPFGIAATSNLYGIEGFHLKDVLGIAAVAIPEALHVKHMHVDVEIHGDLTRGMSVFDRRYWEKTTPNAEVVFEIDTKAVRQYINRVIGY